MKRLAYAAAALLAVFAFAFVSCGEDDSGGGTSTPQGPKEFTVSFDTAGGDPATISPVKVKEGETLGDDFPAKPTKGTDIFEGWFDGTTEYKSDTEITKTVTLVAKWRAKDTTKVAITFDVDGGTPGDPATVEIEPGTSLEDSFFTVTYTKANHRFVGWYDITDTAQTIITASTTFSEDTDLKIKWVEQITITFHLRGGKVDGSETYGPKTIDKGASLGADLPGTSDITPPENETFKGWYKAQDDSHENKVEASTTFEASIDLYAYYEAASATDWTVSFNAEGGTPEPTTITVTKGTVIGEKLPTVTKQGFTFAGWWTKTADVYTTEYTSAGPVVESNIVLHAKWEEVKCECIGCALKDKTAATAGTTKCTCVEGANCPDSCAICIAAGRETMPYEVLTAAVQPIVRGDKTVVLGAVFADLLADADSIKTIGGKGGKAPAGFAWFTNSSGDGNNALQILKPGAVTLADPLKRYRLNVVGRASVDAFGGRGRIELFEIGGAGLGDNAVALSGGRISFDIILTESNVTKGLKLFANTWSGTPVAADIVFSVDDLIVYSEDADEIDDLAIVLAAPVAGATPAATLNATQFTGTITWSPDPVEGKFVKDVQYTATILIKAKAGWQAETLTTTAAFKINGGAISSYDKDEKKIISFPFPGAIDPPPALPLDFTTTTVTVVGTGNVTNADADGFNFTWTGGYGPAPKFKITIPAGFSLASYTTLTFTLEGIAGGFTYKTIKLIAGEADSITSLNDNSPNIGTANYVNGEADLTITIDKAGAAALTGEIDIAIYIHAAGGTQYRFSNFTFNP